MHDPANHAENGARRVALVVGLSAYQHQCVLGNAANDAKKVADTLKARSFTVVSPALASTECFAASAHLSHFLEQQLVSFPGPFPVLIASILLISQAILRN